MIEKALFRLIDDALDNTGTIFALAAPQDAVSPFVIFARADSERWRAINGPSGVMQATFNIDVYAERYYLAKEQAQSIQLALDGFRGDVPVTDGLDPEMVRIAGISFQNDADILDQTDEPQLYRVSAQYLITYHH